MNIVQIYEHTYNLSMTESGTVRGARRQALHDHKRQVILTAAREVFLRAGLAGTTMRAIAANAGYVPGAVYAYFATKEAILSELLVQSLGNLARTMKAAMTGSTDRPEARLIAAAAALHGHYQANRSELELSMSVLQGGTAGFAPELERQVNGRLIAILQVMAEAIQQATGIVRAEAEREAVMLFATIAGLLLLETSGRLAVLRQDGASLVDRTVQSLLERLPR
jgi:AcrR family transcriptional regulator